jgi:hypothetical protein
MMCIQTPGGFVFAGSLFARLGWAGWSSWGIFVLTATMQGILLSLAIYYEVQAHGRGDGAPKLASPLLGRSSALGDDAAADTTPLLQPGRTDSSDRNYSTNQG